MRDIKFRGKNKDIGWVHGQLVYDVNDNAYIIQEVELDSSYGLEETILYATMWYRVENETVGQYTGLKDKNEAEIYEGDIVYIASEDENAFVLWDKETARYIIQFRGWCADFDNFYGKDLEVIRNIYDNKNLLEEVGEEL